MSKPSLRHQLHEIIFEADTPMGKAFDVLLLIFILASVAAVCLESISDIETHHRQILHMFEWGFTILFTLEYLLRIICVGKPRRYIFSFFGIIDLLAILPTYLSLLFTGSHYLVVIRGLRLIRVFRIFKLARFVYEAQTLADALRASQRKITVFVLMVLLLVIFIGSVMYLVEGPERGFSNIPISIYWAIVTLTTVGYGDISPSTPAGQFLASMVMILGYGIIAVPTGIVTAELVQGTHPPISTQACTQCSKEGHDSNALYCKFCGAHL